MDQKCTYTLRIKGTSPREMLLEDVAECINLLAQLIGKDNKPKFSKIVNKSVGIAATIPKSREFFVRHRIQEGINGPAAKAYASIEEKLLELDLKEAELIDSQNNVIYLFKQADNNNFNTARIRQEGFVDGTVTGVVGADDTMHLHFRDDNSQDLKIIIRDEKLARDLLQYFRTGIVRVYMHGTWVRTEKGWLPEASKCYADWFVALSNESPLEIFDSFKELEDNNWNDIKDPLKEWRSIRG